jgi:hypothetical protein
MLISPVLALVAALHTQAAVGQSIAVKANTPTETVTITEPARIELGLLFNVSDIVAVVKIVSGDTENYKTAIYKAVVLIGFKGTAKEQALYFGPFIGQKLGSEYIVFLRNAKEPAVPTTSQTASYGTVKYLEDFNQGYTTMESSYACIFDGNVPEQSCDYGVRVCTDYITLPKGVRAFPPEKDDPPFGCRWVRKSKFISLLDEFAERPGVVQMPASVR